MATKIIGTSGDDTLEATKEFHWIEANAGDDSIKFYIDGGTAFGGAGNDTFDLSPPGTAQVHAYGGLGDDTFLIDTSGRVAPFGMHVWGGEGRDQFHFNNLNSSTQKMTGRLDDFDPSRDEIWVDRVKIDFNDLPSNVRLLEYQGQPWIMIDERVLYVLEGARQLHNIKGDPAEEVHFIHWPKEWANGVPPSADMAYEKFVAYFPENEMSIADGDLTHLRGNDGHNNLPGGDGNEYLHGGDGWDTLSGGKGHDVIDGGEMNDLIYGGAGDDSLSGGLDQDTIYGGAGNDLAYGGSGHDIIYGEAGNDTLHGDRGHDLIFGGAGSDVITGGQGDDVLVGGAGPDSLYGGTGDDLLIADGSGAGTGITAPADRLEGGQGDDTLVGAGQTTVIMVGGDGADTYVAAQNGDIVIEDFDPENDLLDLRGLLPQGEDIADYMQAEIRGGSDQSDMKISLANNTNVWLTGLGNMTPAELESAVLMGDAAMDTEQAIQAQQDKIAQDPDLFGASEHRGEAPPPDRDDPSPAEASHGGGGCFVATASFGNIAHPDVTWLRKFRDTKLVHSASGRAFIRFYWKIGPVLARLVDANGTSGKISRWMISTLVKGLKRLA